jgi:multiple sugar transport system substrate-binding protein
MFDRYGIKYPHEGMSWEEVLQLAAKFPSEDGAGKQYGLSPGMKTSEMAVLMAAAYGLRTVSPELDQTTMDGENWTKLWEKLLLGYKDGWLHEYPGMKVGESYSQQALLKMNPFFTGQAAMTIGSYDIVQDLKMARHEFGMAEFKWDMTTEPVNLQQPDIGPSVRFNDGVSVFAINGASPLKRETWELLKYMTSEESMRLMDLKGELFSNPVRASAMKVEEGQQVDVLHRLKADADRYEMHTLFSESVLYHLSGTIEALLVQWRKEGFSAEEFTVRLGAEAEKERPSILKSLQEWYGEEEAAQ